MPEARGEESVHRGALPPASELNPRPQDLARDREQPSLPGSVVRRELLALRGASQDRGWQLAILNLLDDAEEARRHAGHETHERQKIEDSFWQHEQQFRWAIQEAPIPVIIHAEDGEVLQISRTWTELTGYILSEMPTLNRWLQLAFPQAAQTVSERIRSVFSIQWQTREMDLQIVTRGGERRHWVFTLSAPGTLRDGRRFAVGMALDVTERKRAEDALIRSEQRLRLLIENAREYAIFSTDLERKIVTWNSGAERILGYSEREILGRSADLIFTAEDRAAGACEREAQIALREGRASDERWHCRKDGTLFWGSGVMMAMRGRENEAIGFVKIFRDQTEAKQIQEELAQSRVGLERALQETERARREAEAANRTKDHFLAALSHELRTPLTPVLMAAESLLRRQDLPARVVEALQMICRNVEIEKRFVDDLLDVTRIAHGKMELICSRVDLHEVLRQTLEICQDDFRSKEHALTLRLTADRASANGDFSRLQQVFWNLLKNASKFTPSHGQITVSSSNEEDAWIKIQITDTGRGIEPQSLPFIFDAFRQGDEQITREFGGLGLGLAIALGIVHAHGGTIAAESPGRDCGSTFTVRLPLMPSSA